MIHVCKLPNEYHMNHKIFIILSLSPYVDQFYQNKIRICVHSRYLGILHDYRSVLQKGKRVRPGIEVLRKLKSEKYREQVVLSDRRTTQLVLSHIVFRDLVRNKPS